jgi:glutamate dehydrogenase/leucine dehydrogenase
MVPPAFLMPFRIERANATVYTGFPAQTTFRSSLVAMAAHPQVAYIVEVNDAEYTIGAMGLDQQRTDPRISASRLIFVYGVGMSEQETIAVIGAGAIGTAAAFALAREGRRVLLLDRDEPGVAGASFGNAGHIAQESVQPLPSPGPPACAERYF